MKTPKLSIKMVGAVLSGYDATDPDRKIVRSIAADKRTINALVRRGLAHYIIWGVSGRMVEVPVLTYAGVDEARRILAEATGPHCRKCGGAVDDTIIGPGNNPDSVCGPRYCHWAWSN